MPYRIDVRAPLADALDRLVHLGALDVESTPGGLAALIPDGVSPEEVATALGTHTMAVSPAKGRDDDSVWMLSPRTVRVGHFLLVPSGMPALPDAIIMSDGPAFGTGLHPTTALCLEALDEVADERWPPSVLDVGTGSGILALAALTRGVPQAVGLDIDWPALKVAAGNAGLNGLSGRLQLIRGGPESVHGAWPLVFANVQAAPLIDMAPTLVRRVAHEGQLILSGLPDALIPEVERAYCHLGMRPHTVRTRAGWSAITLQPSW